MVRRYMGRRYMGRRYMGRRYMVRRRMVRRYMVRWRMMRRRMVRWRMVRRWTMRWPMAPVSRRNIPMLPAIIAAPAVAVPPFIAAPIPAGSTPARRIPAVASVVIVMDVELDGELDVLDVTRRQRPLQSVEQRRGLGAIGVQRTANGQRKCRHRCQDEFSHNVLRLVSCNADQLDTADTQKSDVQPSMPGEIIERTASTRSPCSAWAAHLYR
jgi:hypothetical protein